MCFDVELSEIGNALATSVTRASDVGETGQDGAARRVGDRREDPVERGGRIFTHGGEYSCWSSRPQTTAASPMSDLSRSRIPSPTSLALALPFRRRY